MKLKSNSRISTMIRYFLIRKTVQRGLGVWTSQNSQKKSSDKIERKLDHNKQNNNFCKETLGQKFNWSQVLQKRKYNHWNNGKRTWSAKGNARS